MKAENMNEAMTFSNNGVEEVREITIDGKQITIDGKRWFIGMDVAKSLGYGCNNSNNKASAKAIREHTDTEDKGVSEIDTPQF